MTTRNHLYTNLVLAASMLAFGQTAWSLGLGEAKLESFLGEPLEVKIELITRPSDDLASISASLASAADYELIGASRDDVSMPLQFSVENLDGNAFISVSSKLDVNNPVLRLILEVNWSSGRMLREYTLFLDPPTFSRPAPAPRIEAESLPQPVPSQPVDSSARAALTSAAAEYGPVQSGDTLWRIAKDWSAGSELNLNKVMLAIQRENPHAFSNNNINLLRRGVILRMPETEEINSMSLAAANSEAIAQHDAFEARRNINRSRSATPLMADQSAALEPAQSTLAPGQPAQEEQAVSEPVTESETLASESIDQTAPGQLELLPPSDDMSLDRGNGLEESSADPDALVSAQELREELSRKEEDLINQQQQNAYLEQRVQELESLLADSREGTVEDQNLADMEQRLQEERLDAAQTAVPQVVSSQAPDQPWYKRFPLWLLGLLIVLAGAAGWLMSRRGAAEGAPGLVGGIKDEAEDVLRVLDSASPQETVREEVTQEIMTEDAGATQPAESEETKIIPDAKKSSEQDEEDQLLDEESADPEIQLDLARAYVSMGDKEAARVILEEIIAHGSEEQQVEAKKMKDLL